MPKCLEIPHSPRLRVLLFLSFFIFPIFSFKSFHILLPQVGLDCLTAQSSLFGMREHGGCMRGDPTKQEALLDFIGNLGAGFGF